jgi:hypothetical protein
MVKQTQKQPRCQCVRSCKTPPLKNSPFCRKHRICKRISPLTGYEPKYNPDLYNKKKGVKESLNCFAYAFDYQKLPKNCTENSCSAPFPQPGRASGHNTWSQSKGKRCPDVVGRLLGDIPSLKLSSFTRKCPKKYSKIALVVDEDEDYHFYRQDSNRFWSHKPGASNVTSKDGTGHAIYDPHLASRYYKSSGLNYDEFCTYLCAPKDKIINLKYGGKHGSNKTRKKSI